MANKFNQDIYIIGALRTPIGKLNGALAHLRPDDMGAELLNALCQKYTIPKEKINHLVIGCANQAGEDNRNLARMIGLLTALPYDTTALTLNSLCASGMEAIITGTRGIALGEHDLVITGGVESMSRSPWVTSKVNGEKVDSLIGWRFINPAMEVYCPTLSMPETAELLAKQYNISQKEQNQYAFDSRQRYEIALKNACYEEEILAIKDAKGKIWKQDEQHRELSLDLLGKLPKLVKNGNCITSGNAAKVGDGAALVALASEAFVSENNIQPLAKVAAWSVAACHPSKMGVSAVAACRKLFENTTQKIEEIQRIELSESFAVQLLACLEELKVNPAIVNVNGGGISMGNPIAMGSARQLVSLVHQLQADKTLENGLATACAGLGIGTAVLLTKF